MVGLFLKEKCAKNDAIILLRKLFKEIEKEAFFS